uniref:LIM and SH3 domain protein Lasp n=1 Tax=Macrostomum lignano TaxID=282301 RepID=A0A1I8JFV2_9PLAT
MENVCSSCSKAVYSMELLKCMDQAWHRTCFKCQTCGTTLNINNYKAYDKRPYCKVHYPESKAYTFVTDNQEIRRVKQNTAVISSASYTKRRASAISNDNSNTVVVNRRFSEIPASQSADARRSRQELQHQSSYQPGSINDFDPEEHNTLSRGLDPNAGRRGSTVFISPASSSRPASEIDSVVEVSPSKPEANNVKAEEVPLPQPAVPEPKPDEVPEAKSEVVPEAKSEVVPEAKSEVVPEAKLEEVPEAKLEERCFRAQFAYKAQDSDEVSFDVGDVITNGDPVDSGWMYGIVERTKQYGLLPSNYVIEEASQAF